MTFVLLPVEMIDAIHESVLNPGELPGRARDKSLEGPLSRVVNRLDYGLIKDVYDLAAAYAIAISQGHCFNDGNKRTAFRAMNAALAFNGVTTRWTVEAVGPVIIRAAQRLMDEGELAEWLRRNIRG